MIKRLIKKYYPNILEELVKEKLKGFQSSDKWIDEITIEDKDKLLTGCNLIFENKSFKKVADYLIQGQIDFTVKEALDMNQVSFGRATINGIMLMMEEIERLNTMYKEQIKVKDKYDEYQVI